MLEMSSQSAPATRHAGPSSLAYNLAGIAVLVLLLAVGMAYLIDSLGRTTRLPPPDHDDAEPVSQTISGRYAESASPISSNPAGSAARSAWYRNSRVNRAAMAAP